MSVQWKGSKPRKSKLRTFSLSPEGEEALELIDRQDGINNLSRTVDRLIVHEAERRGWVLRPVKETTVQVKIISEGKELPILKHNDEAFLPAAVGKDYEVELWNNSPQRRLAVLSVDGVNVVNGDKAGYSGPGYVLEPWARFRVKGFLRTHDEAAAFKFSAIEKSYAAQTGHGTTNVGIIGCAVFDEQRPWWTVTYRPGAVGSGSTTTTYTTTGVQRRPPDLGDGTYVDTNISDTREFFTLNSVRSDSAEPQKSRKGPKGRTDGLKSSTRYRMRGGASGQSVNSESTMDFMEIGCTEPAAPDMGTEYGQKVTMRTQDTSFTRASETPIQVVLLRYASKEVLKSWGVPVDQGPPNRPDAFPAEQPMVAEPPGWKG